MNAQLQPYTPVVRLVAEGEAPGVGCVVEVQWQSTRLPSHIEIILHNEARYQLAQLQVTCKD